MFWNKYNYFKWDTAGSYEDGINRSSLKGVMTSFIFMEDAVIFCD